MSIEEIVSAITEQLSNRRIAEELMRQVGKVQTKPAEELDKLTETYYGDLEAVRDAATKELQRLGSELAREAARG